MLALLAAVLVTANPTQPPKPASRSVYRLNPWLDSAVIGSSLGVVTGAYVWGGGLITRRCPCDPASVNPIDRVAIGNHSAIADYGSDVTVGLAVAAPIALALSDSGLSREAAEDLTVEGETMAVSGGLVTIAKYSVQRPLPVVYAGQAPNLINQPGGYRSFYSGHTTLAMSALSATAMTWQLRHGASAWPWLVVGVVGGAVGVQRVLAGRHFPSDVVVGGLTGTAVGIVVPWLHERRDVGSLGITRTALDSPVLVWSRSFDPGR